jgi:hypothetical protein
MFVRSNPQHSSHAIAAAVIPLLGHRHLSAAIIIILIIFAVTTITSG